MNDYELIIYAAGFFDGEGNVSTTHSSGYRSSIRTSISQQDRRPLELLQGKWGGSIYHLQHNGARQNPIYKWHLGVTEALNFLLDIEPYCIVKASAIRAAKEFHALVIRQRNGRGKTVGITTEQIAEREELADKLYVYERGYQSSNE